MGLLSNRGPPPWHPATQEIKNACKQAAEYCQVYEGHLYKNSTLIHTCEISHVNHMHDITRVISYCGIFVREM